jgi:uracil-DNA glycosylase
MSLSSVKKKIDAALLVNSSEGSKVSLDEAKAIAIEAKKRSFTKLEKKAVKDLFDSGALTAAATVEIQSLLGDDTLKSLIPADWQKALAKDLATPSFAKLESFLAAENKSGANIFPPRNQIFAALSQTPLNKVRVVVIGQDPYPTAGNANGLAFSVSPGMKVPASLKNIYAGLAADVHTATPTSGDLTPWAKEGVLLINTVLTVREGAPNSHRAQGWEDLTAAMLKKVNETQGPVVFICLGAQAKAMAESMVDTSKHTILSAPHPSPLNGKAFVNAVAKDHLFTHTNEILKAGGRGAVNWQIP